MHCKLAGIKNKYPTVIGAHHGMGLVAGLHMVKPGGTGAVRRTRQGHRSQGG